MGLRFRAPHHSITNSHASIKGATRSMTSYPPSFYDSLYFWWILMQLADGNPFQYPQTVCFCEDRHNPQRNHKFQTFTEKSAGEKRSITELHNSVRKTGIKNKQCPPTGSEEGFSLGPRVRLYSAPNCNLGCKGMWSEAGTPRPTKRSFTRLLVPHPLSAYSMPGAVVGAEQ